MRGFLPRNVFQMCVNHEKHTGCILDLVFAGTAIKPQLWKGDAFVLVLLTPPKPAEDSTSSTNHDLLIQRGVTQGPPDGWDQWPGSGWDFQQPFRNQGAHAPQKPRARASLKPKEKL